MDIGKAILSLIIINQLSELICWCVDGSQKNNIFTRLWSNATKLTTTTTTSTTTTIHLSGETTTTTTTTTTKQAKQRGRGICIHFLESENMDEEGEAPREGGIVRKDVKKNMEMTVGGGNGSEEASSRKEEIQRKETSQETDATSREGKLQMTGKEVRDEESWRNLPLELWAEIGKRLESRLDILRFRSVCTLWRSSLPSPTRFPLKVPSLPNCVPEFDNVPYFIIEVCVYSVCGLGNMLVSFEEVDQDGKFHGRFLSPEEFEFNYPTISFMAPSEHPISQLSFQGKANQIRMDSLAKRAKGLWDWKNNIGVKKLVLISSNGDSVNPSYARASDLSVVAHLSFGEMKGRLALLRLGGSPENWVWETDFCSRVFEHIATYKGKLCTMDPSGRVYVMDYHSLQMIQICDSSSNVHELQHRHLVEARGDLYLADSSKRTTSGPREAYKLNLRLQKWLKVEDVTDMVSALIPYLL